MKNEPKVIPMNEIQKVDSKTKTAEQKLDGKKKQKNK